MSVKKVTMHEVTCDACVAEVSDEPTKPFETLTHHPTFRYTFGLKSVDLCGKHGSVARNAPEQIAALLTPPEADDETAPEEG